MPFRRTVAAVAILLLPALACPPNAAAEGLLRRLVRFGPRAAVVEHVQPAGMIGRACLMPGCAAHGPSGSTFAQGVPTFNYGYFGAHGQGVGVCHRGYYDDYTQWSYRRSY